KLCRRSPTAVKRRGAIAMSKHEVEPFAVKPVVAAVMENCSVDRIYKLLRAGELEGFKDGRNTKITMASIKARRARLIPNPIDQNPWAHWRSPMDMMRQG